MSPSSQPWNQLAETVLADRPLTREQALSVLNCPDADVLSLMHAAFRVRLVHFGRRVRVHVLQNAKSGRCSEDCGFCSQSQKHNANPPTHGMKTVDELVAGAEQAVAKGAVTYCMVTSARGPSSNDINTITEAARRIKPRFPDLRLCASLGILRDEQAKTLVEAGIDRYNHNLETAASFFDKVVSTHAFSERVATVRIAKAAGMEACCGGIIGMGETLADRVELAFALRDLQVESAPLNFLDPRPGTPMEKQPRPTPLECIKAMAMFRLVLPKTDVRMAGGREVTLRSLQPLGLYAATSMFTSGYLTTPGAEPSDDFIMIRDAGFEAVVLEG